MFFNWFLKYWTCRWKSYEWITIMFYIVWCLKSATFYILNNQCDIRLYEFFLCVVSYWNYRLYDFFFRKRSKFYCVTKQIPTLATKIGRRRYILPLPITRSIAPTFYCPFRLRWTCRIAPVARPYTMPLSTATAKWCSFSSKRERRWMHSISEIAGHCIGPPIWATRMSFEFCWTTARKWIFVIRICILRCTR